MTDMTNNTETNANTIFAKVVVVPGQVSEVALETGATVAVALAAAGITPGPNQTISLNGTTASADASVSDGARIVISTSAKSAA